MINFASAKRADASDLVLEMRHVTMRHARVQLKDASLNVRRGELVTLFGPAGSGKTSLLRIAAGLDHVAGGEVYVGDRAVDSPKTNTFTPPIGRSAGIVLKPYAVWPHMTVSQNVAYPLGVRGERGIAARERVSVIVEQVGLGGMEQQSASRLEARQQLLLAIGRALATSPDILLLDDPLSALGPEDGQRMRGELRLMQRRLGVAMVVATSSEAEALSLSDRIVVMEAGAVKHIGTPVELYEYPTSETLRDRMGRSELIACQVVALDEDGATVALQSTDGAEVRVANVHGEGIGPGREGTVSVRPRGVSIAPLGETDADDATNVLPGIIASLMFMGDRYQATIELPWRDVVTTEIGVAQEWREGQPVAVIMKAADLHLWTAPLEDESVEDPDNGAEEPPAEPTRRLRIPTPRRLRIRVPRARIPGLKLGLKPFWDRGKTETSED